MIQDAGWAGGQHRVRASTAAADEKPGGVKGTFSCARIGTVLHPAVLLAFVDSACFLKYRYGLSA
jgi:hypothetical protein